MPLVLSSTTGISTSNVNISALPIGSVLRKPNLPAFFYYNSGGQTATSTNTKYTFYSTNLFDTTAGGYSTANSRFTAQVAGKYFIEAKLNVLSPPSGASYQQLLMKNGSGYGQYHTYIHGPAPRWDVVTKGVFQLAVGDYVELFVNASSNTTIDNAGYFYGFFIG